MIYRIFLSVAIDKAAREELGRAQDKLVATNSNKRIAWVDPLLMHITLHFIGKTDEKQLEHLRQILKTLEKDYEEIKLSLDKLSFFPSANNQRIFIVKINDDNENLARLRERIGSELAKGGFVVDSRKFTPHITLGRIKNGTMDRLVDINKLSWNVSSFELMHSQLSGNGSKYRIIESYSLI